MFKNLLEKFRKDKLPPILVPQLMHTHEQQPVSFTRGDNARLWDMDGTEYFDAVAGTGAAILGHAHPSISEAVSLQADRLLHVGNQFHIVEQAQLAQTLCALAEQEKVYFCDSPAAANRAAFELLAKAARRQARQGAKVLVLAEQSASLGVIEGLEIQTIDFDDIDSIGRFASDAGVFALVLPSMLCAKGVQRCSSGYLQAVRELCDEHNWLLVLDERLTGLGRTGVWFAYQHEQVSPDLVIGPAALANGLPIGALLARGEIANAFEPGDQYSEFGGNPLASKVALATIETIEKEELLASAKTIGEELKRKIKHHIGTLDGVIDIRGNGLLIVIELEQARAQLASKFLLQGLVVDVVDHGRYIRLTPPISIRSRDADKLAEKIHTVLSAL